MFLFLVGTILEHLWDGSSSRLWSWSPFYQMSLRRLRAASNYFYAFGRPSSALPWDLRTRRDGRFFVVLVLMHFCSHSCGIRYNHRRHAPTAATKCDNNYHMQHTCCISIHTRKSDALPAAFLESRHCVRGFQGADPIKRGGE